MHFGIIEINDADEVMTKTGVVTRRGVSLDSDDVWRDSSALEMIYLVAALPRTVVCEIELPAPLSGHNLENALRFELENLLPVPLETVSWGYCRLGRQGTRFRLFAVHREETAKLLEKVAHANLGCDYFLPAQLLEEASVPSGTAKTLFTPLQLLLNYLPGDPSGRNLWLAADLIPPELKPVRHRQWKLLYHLTLVLLLLVAAAVLVSRYRAYAVEYRALATEQSHLNQELAQAQTQSRELAAGQELAQKLAEAKIGSAAVLPILADLNGRLPDYMWLANYTQSGNEIELTIISTQDDPNLPRILDGSELYKFTNMSKTTRMEDHTTTFSVKLRSLLP